MTISFTCNYCGSTIIPKGDCVTMCMCSESVENLEREQRAAIERSKQKSGGRRKRNRGGTK